MLDFGAVLHFFPTKGETSELYVNNWNANSGGEIEGIFIVFLSYEKKHLTYLTEALEKLYLLCSFQDCSSKENVLKMQQYLP